jgi:hypothetical protein
VASAKVETYLKLVGELFEIELFLSALFSAAFCRVTVEDNF